MAVGGLQAVVHTVKKKPSNGGARGVSLLPDTASMYANRGAKVRELRGLPIHCISPYRSTDQEE